MIRGVILDLDGTVYLGHVEVPGASAFVSRCRAAGIRCLFVTNRANRTPEEVAEQISGYGVACGPEDVLTSAQATARVLKPGRAFCIGEDALVRALTEAGFTIGEERPDYVIVGFDRTFNYDKLRKACSFIAAGARFVATNPDRALKLASGITPGTGSIVAAVEAGSGCAPLVIGKPERLIMDMALAVLGTRPDETLVVGDNLVTDVPAGAAAGMATALILTGVSRREEVPAAAVAPTWVVEDFEALWTVIEQSNRSRGSAAMAGGERMGAGGGVHIAAPVAVVSGWMAAQSAGGGPRDAQYWIRTLDMKRHPEGGYFRETYRAEESIPAEGLPERFGGARSFSTAIHFLLERGEFSAFHRIRSDEIWHFYDGHPLRLHVLGPDGRLESPLLGRDPGCGQRLQVVVPAGAWFAAELEDGGAFALVGCTVAPGFDFADFEMASCRDLLAAFPGQRERIVRLVRLP